MVVVPVRLAAVGRLLPCPLQPLRVVVRHDDVISARRDGVRNAVSEYEDFFRANIGRARSLAHLITGSRCVGQEIAQEAMLAVHESVGFARAPRGVPAHGRREPCSLGPATSDPRTAASAALPPARAARDGPSDRRDVGGPATPPCRATHCAGVALLRRSQPRRDRRAARSPRRDRQVHPAPRRHSLEGAPR